jgi:hypothetical protein
MGLGAQGYLRAIDALTTMLLPAERSYSPEDEAAPEPIE